MRGIDVMNDEHTSVFISVIVTARKESDRLATFLTSGPMMKVCYNEAAERLHRSKLNCSEVESWHYVPADETMIQSV